MNKDNILEVSVVNNKIQMYVDGRYYDPLTDEQKKRINKLAQEMIETLNKPGEVLN